MCRAVALACQRGSRSRFRSTADRVVPSRHIKRNIGELAGDTRDRVRRHGPPLLGLGCPHGGSYISAPSPAYRVDHQFSAFANWHSRVRARNDGGAGNTVAGPIFDLNRTGRFRPDPDIPCRDGFIRPPRQNLRCTDRTKSADAIGSCSGKALSESMFTVKFPNLKEASVRPNGAKTSGPLRVRAIRSR